MIFIAPSTFMPACPRCLFLDLFFIFSISVQALSIVFGASYMQLTNFETAIAILLAPLFILVAIPFIDTMILFTVATDMWKDYKSGTVTFKVTDKSSKIN
jgi:hypothetical protein